MESGLSDKTKKLAGRLSKLLYRLNLGEHLCIQELADDYGVSIRTIQKDLNSRFAHLPIRKDAHGSYFLDPSSLGRFNLEDIKRLINAYGVSRLYPELNQKLITALLNPCRLNAIHVIGNNYEVIDDKAENFFRLIDFISKRQSIKFQYNGKDYREMKPYRLINYLGIWYLVTENPESELKSFPFKKLKRIAFTGNYFHPKPEIQIMIEESDNIRFKGADGDPEK